MRDFYSYPSIFGDCLGIQLRADENRVRIKNGMVDRQGRVTVVGNVSRGKSKNDIAYPRNA